MRITYINLRRSPERALALEAHLSDLGLSATRFEAVDGAALTPAQRRMYDGRARRGRGAPPMTENEIACFLSHRAVWQIIVASGQPGVVLEDDTRFASDAPAILNQVSKLGLGEIMRLDGYRRRPALPMGLRCGDRRIVQLCSGPCGANAYVLSAPAAARLVAVSTRFNDPVDIFLDQFHHHRLSVFAVLPYPASLCPTFADRSTIGCLRSVWEAETRLQEGISDRLRRRACKLRRSGIKAAVALAIVLRWPARVMAVAGTVPRDVKHGIHDVRATCRSGKRAATSL